MPLPPPPPRRRPTAPQPYSPEPLWRIVAAGEAVPCSPRSGAASSPASTRMCVARPAQVGAQGRSTGWTSPSPYTAPTARPPVPSGIRTSAGSAVKRRHAAYSSVLWYYCIMTKDIEGLMKGNEVQLTKHCIFNLVDFGNVNNHSSSSNLNLPLHFWWECYEGKPQSQKR